MKSTMVCAVVSENLAGPVREIGAVLIPPSELRPDLASAADVLFTQTEFLGPSDVHKLVQDHRGLAVIVVLTDDVSTSQAFSYVRAGAADLIRVQEEWSAQLIRRRVERVHGARLESEVISRQKRASAGREALLRNAIRVGVRGGLPRDLRRVNHVSATSLLRLHRMHGLPTPEETLKWVRVLRAAEVLEGRSASASLAARRSGYATSGSLSRATRAVLGCSAHELRYGESMADVADRLTQRIAPRG